MRILHVHSGNIFGGVERILIALAAQPNVEHIFALCFPGRLSNELSGAGAQVYLLPSLRLSRPWEILRARASLKELLRRQSFDLAIVHSAWSHNAFAGVLRKTGLPELFWLHTKATRSSLLEKFASLHSPARVLSVSAAVDQTAHILFPGAASSVVYSPLALDAAAFVPIDRAKLGAKPSDVVILQASRLEAWKGHAELIRGLQLLRDYPGWTCWIAGGASNPAEAEYLAHLRELARDLGPRIQFLDARNDIPALLAAADIYCQPNLESEGFSIVFMEAFFASLPIVTSALGGATEIVDANSGILLKPGDVPAVADALLQLIRNPDLRQKLGANGRRQLLERCDPVTQFKKLEQVFSETITAHG